MFDNRYNISSCHLYAPSISTFRMISVKIALVNSEFPSPTGADHGGIATYTYTLANFLHQKGHTVHILTRSGIHSEEIHHGIEVHHLQSRYTRNIAQRIFNRMRRTLITWEKGFARDVRACLLGIKKKQGLDLVEYPEYGGLGLYCRNLQGIATVATLHTPTELVDELNEKHPDALRRAFYRMEKISVLKADSCKSPSSTLRTNIAQRYHLDEKKITVLRNPFDLTELRNTFHAKDESCSARFDILFSGRLEYRKGAQIILRSINNILAIHRNITFTIAGETEIHGHQNYRAAIERLLDSFERTRLWFPGPLSHKYLLPLYKNSSLFLFPSLYENSPYALLEAMACGIPVVAANTGGISEIIRHGENGLLFSLNDLGEPCASIKRLFKDRSLATQLGQNAAAFIAERYNQESVTNEYEAFYTAACEKIHTTS